MIEPTGDRIHELSDAVAHPPSQEPSPVEQVIAALAGEAHRLAGEVLAMPGRSPLEVICALQVRRAFGPLAQRMRPE